MAQTVEQRRRLASLLCPNVENDRFHDYSLQHSRECRRDYFSIESWIRKDLNQEDLPIDLRGKTSTSGTGVSDIPNQISREKWFREEAAIWVLEAIGTDDAVAIVKRMATGHPDARPTIAAKEVLARRVR